MNSFNLHRRWALWLCVAFSLLVHLPGLTSPLLDYHAYRQCQTASMARNYARHGMHFLSPELDTEGRPQRAGTEFPLYSYLLAILFKLFGTHDILGRLLSAGFAAWGAAFLFLFARERLGENRALWSGLVMSVIPVHLFFTRTVQPESAALWGLLGFLYFADRWLRYGRWTHAVLALLLGAVASLLKLPMMYLLAGMAAYLGWEHGGWKKLRSVPFVLLIMGIVVLTAAWYQYAKTAPVAVLPLSRAEHLENLRAVFTWGLWRSQFISRLPELCSTYSGLLFAGVGIYVLRKENNLRFWAAWFVFTAAYIVLLGRYGLIHRYTLLPFAPVMAVTIACGIDRCWSQANGQGLKIVTTLLVLGIPLHAGLRIKHWYHLEYPWVFEARKVVEKLSGPEELLITNTREHPVLLYHLNRYGYSPDLEETGLGVIKAYQAQGAHLFLTPTDEGWSRHPEFAAYFNQNAQLLHQNPRFLLYRLRS